MEKNRDMLSGSIWKSILVFFFPILVGTFFQQLYNTVDAAIVGHFASDTALASVGGSAAIIVNLVVGFFTGLSGGCTVLVSQFFGAGDKQGLEDSLHTSYAFGILGGIVLGIIGIVFSPAILRLMNTDELLMNQSVVYLRVYFAGLIFVFIYNMGSAVLRALGDSKRPLYYLIICTVINIVLDLLFVLGFSMDVFGVALATLISQAISAILVTECLMHRSKEVKLHIGRIGFKIKLLKRMLAIGFPSGIQSSCYSISNMVIQAAINLFGITAVAAWTTTGKIDVIFWMINGSFGIAAATFAGQNFGAGNYQRMRKGIRTCLYMALASAVLVSAFLLTLGRYCFILFTTDAGVTALGTHMLEIIVPAYVVFVFIEIFSAALRAQGDTLVPTIINIVGIVAFRCIWVYIFRKTDTVDVILYSYPLSWIISALAMSGYYLYRRNKICANMTKSD